MKLRRLLLPVILLLLCASAAASPPAPGISWRAWSPATFAQAKSENRPVFLYLEAVWCHWCHVMQQDTFSDPAVQQALARDYVAVRVDHDANPALATRYRDYGWPALIFFAPDGSEIVKRAGFIAPRDFTRLLQAIVADPSPENLQAAIMPSVGTGTLTPELRLQLLNLHDQDYDLAAGGLRSPHKFIDRDSVEYAISHGDKPAEMHKAQQTLDAAAALIDPVWGGAYQYSTGGDWRHPHYEKLMRVQAGYLRIYALAYARWHREADLARANAIMEYMRRFLRSPKGAFYVSQDADLVRGEKSDGYFQLDDASRRKRGMPRIDQHLYADANGQAAEALVQFYEASGNTAALQLAREAVDWTLQNRSLPHGGFRHGTERDGPYLSDSLAMARAFLALHRATGERAWLDHASSTAQFIARQFRNDVAGFNPAAANGLPTTPQPDIADNIASARLFNLMAHYTGSTDLHEMARHAMKFLSAAARMIDFEEAGILLADEELAHEPAHFTIVAARKDPAAAALHAMALRAPGSYKRVEWWDPAEGPLANDDVRYPKLPKAGAFICASGRCSLPSFSPGDYARRIAGLAGS